MRCTLTTMLFRLKCSSLLLFCKKAKASFFRMAVIFRTRTDSYLAVKIVSVSLLNRMNERLYSLTSSEWINQSNQSLRKSSFFAQLFHFDVGFFERYSSPPGSSRLRQRVRVRSQGTGGHSMVICGARHGHILSLCRRQHVNIRNNNSSRGTGISLECIGGFSPLTETSIVCDEFDAFLFWDGILHSDLVGEDVPEGVENEVALVFFAKEARVMIKFCCAQQQNQNIVDGDLRTTVLFHWGGRPIVIETEVRLTRRNWYCPQLRMGC